MRLERCFKGCGLSKGRVEQNEALMVEGVNHEEHVEVSADSKHVHGPGGEDVVWRQRPLPRLQLLT